jgi:RIO-like serine/threonine protein kinase
MDTSYWQTIHDTSAANERRGGTILMKPGILPMISRENFYKCLDDINRCLNATHQANYFHCDIRKANVLMFDDEYQLIDYDHALPVNASTFRFVEGAQYGEEAV